MGALAVVGRGALLLVLVPAAGLVVARALGLDGPHPLPALLTVVPWAVVLLLVLAVVAAVAGLPREAAVAGLVGVLGLALLVPRVVPGPSPAAAPTGPRLTVAVANLRVGEADAAALVEHVRARDVDVLVTLELTEAAIARLTDAGLDELLPQRELQPSRFTSGGGIHARLPLTPLPPDEGRGFGRTPRAEVELPDGRAVDVVAVHPLPPVEPEWVDRWRATLAALPDPGTPAAPRLLLGDLNATLDHAPLRALLDRGWVDAADATGDAWRPTFHGLPFGEPVPPVTLDHVLVDRRTAVVDVEVLPLPGSDHRLLVAELWLPAAP